MGSGQNGTKHKIMNTIYNKVKNKYPSWKDSSVDELVDRIVELAPNGLTKIDLAIHRLKKQEKTPEAKKLVAFIMSSQEAYKQGQIAQGLEPRYYGETNMEISLKDRVYEDLSISCNEYQGPETEDGSPREIGYTIVFSYPVGNNTVKRHIGVGEQAVTKDWDFNE